MTGKVSKTKIGGFTLVESVMAVMILGIAMGACVLSFSMAMKTVSTAGNQMAAMHYARDQMEVIRTNEFADITFNSALLITNLIPASANCTVTYSVTNIDSATKNITVTATYLNRLRGGASTNTLMTSVTSTLHQ